MKNILIFCLSVSLFISCSGDKDIVINDATNLHIQVPPNTSDKGIIPQDHPISKALMDPSEYDFNELDKLYKEAVPASKEHDYYENIKQIGFK